MDDNKSVSRRSWGSHAVPIEQQTRQMARTLLARFQHILGKVSSDTNVSITLSMARAMLQMAERYRQQAVRADKACAAGFRAMMHAHFHLDIITRLGYIPAQK